VAADQKAAAAVFPAALLAAADPRVAAELSPAVLRVAAVPAAAAAASPAAHPAAAALAEAAGVCPVWAASACRNSRVGLSGGPRFVRRSTRERHRHPASAPRRHR
jgi:hypothetical protein